MRGVVTFIGCFIAANTTGASAAPYTPVSQVLTFCKSDEVFNKGVCFGYIMGTVETATVNRPDPTSEDYFTNLDLSPAEMINKVKHRLQAVPPEEGSSPATPIILRALRKHPLKEGL